MTGFGESAEEIIPQQAAEKFASIFHPKQRPKAKTDRKSSRKFFRELPFPQRRKESCTVLHPKRKKNVQQNRLAASLWERSVAFHGRACRDLAIGVRVCQTALERLGLDETNCRERLVCVSESDGCAVDAVQASLGCTMGKKHLLFFNTGRLIFSVYDLQTDRSIRLCVREQVAEGNFAPEEILAMRTEELFSFEEARPMTVRVRKKATRGCTGGTECISRPMGSIHDSLEPFREFDESRF